MNLSKLLQGLLVFAVLSAGSISAGADLVVGSRAAASGNVAGAYHAWLPLAISGNPAAQFNLGLLYESIANERVEVPADAAAHDFPVDDDAAGNYLRAYAWYSVAARARLMVAAERRDEVAARLTGRERVAAARWAREMLVSAPAWPAPRPKPE